MSNFLKDKALFIDFDSTFVKVETIDELAKFSLKNDPDIDTKVRMISNITNQAMSGELDFPSALDKRLSILSLTKNDISKVSKQIENLVSDSINDNRSLIQSISDSIWILSGGFCEVIRPIVSKFGIDKSHVIANTFTYSDDIVNGCDKNNDLFKDKGKVRAIKRINPNKHIIMIGDGYTDYEAYKSGAANTFICYTENIYRDNVAEKSSYIANNFNEVLDIISQL